jgi:hypothetical protein
MTYLNNVFVAQVVFFLFVCVGRLLYKIVKGLDGISIVEIWRLVKYCDLGSEFF